MTWQLGIVFLLGIANFAIHRAVLSSGHELVARLSGSDGRPPRKALMSVEFAVLLAAMFMAAANWAGIAWAYGAYTALNAVTCWLLLRGHT